MKNVWSELVSCSLCFVFYCFYFFSLVHTNNMGITFIPLWTNIVAYSILIVSHDSSITFLLIVSKLMFYLLHSHFASSQRFLNPFPLLILDAYHLQVIWLPRPLSYFPLDNTSNISYGFLKSL